MEPVWNGLLTCDYERTRPTATLLEWDLYTTSLINWPQVFLNAPTPYGRLRRPGIVDIPESDHTRLITALHQHLADLSYTRDLIKHAVKHRHDAGDLLAQADRALQAGDIAVATGLLATATGAFLKVMSTHIVNWLLPEQRWEQLLTELFDHDTHAARTCLSALMTPDNPGHLLAPHAAPTALVCRHPEPAESDTTSGLIEEARKRATAHREAWATAALLAAAGINETVHELRAVIALCRWAADSEERRKELRDRYLTTAQRWSTATGTDCHQITTADLLPTKRIDQP